jgi:hypothetical protein
MLEIKWTPDCQGKWDYDGDLVRVSTRYWPRGGSAHIYQGGQFVSDQHSPERQHIKPSANSTIYVGEDFDDVWREKDFTGETEAEVKAAVEQWVAEQYGALRLLLGMPAVVAPPPEGE